ncbi:endosome-associated-trafficking regulator 1 isoform X2 [Rhineura floridana]|uniref:endosome-associated-trafficking regulator 1 isoform X2 n=1 Tax=Rhineura floridana TaxID=261503 RepID=UPI002AC8741D|nr:endosome-associated-trafficking regulator 1 isoform X2 [Rhineura floridana]
MAGRSRPPPAAAVASSSSGLERPWGGPAVGPPGSPGEEANPFSFKEFVRSKNQNVAAATVLEAKSAGDVTLESGAGSSPKLKEENSKLRSKISHLQAVSEARAERVKELERTLEESKWKEEREARDLEAMVQQVEENLERMTKRAMKAETSTVKLKQENTLLQVQMENYRLGNEALKSGHLANLAVVKQNADVALQNLLTVITKSRSSVKQLLSGAEELQLVAELLKSIDKISEVPQASP